MTDIPDIQKPHRNANKYIPIEALIQTSTENPRLTMEQIGKIHGITKNTVSVRFRHVGYVPQRLKEYKEHKADIFDFMCSKIVNAMTPRGIKKASFLQQTTAFGIFYDKMRIERGLSTTNIGIQAELKANDKDLKVMEAIEQMFSVKELATDNTKDASHDK